MTTKVPCKVPQWSLSLLSNIVFSVILDKMENKNRTCAIKDASILYDSFPYIKWFNGKIHKRNTTIQFKACGKNHDKTKHY